jgi:hypothetical protein
MSLPKNIGKQQAELKMLVACFIVPFHILIDHIYINLIE